MNPEFGIICISISLCITILYHMLFFGRIFLTNAWDIQFSDNFSNNILWVHKHREKVDAANVTLAIQALRNTTVAAIFIGGNAFQAGMTAVTLCANSSRFDVKIGEGVVALFMFLSFLSWATVIRASAHLGFHIDTLSYLCETFPSIGTANVNSSVSNASNVTGNAVIDEELGQIPLFANYDDGSRRQYITVKNIYCQRLMSFNTIFFSLGFRFIFMSIPYMFVTVGPIELMVATAVVLGYIIAWDFPIRV